MKDLKSISSLYIHFPYCTALCNYCDFFRTKSDGNFAPYFEYFSQSVPMLKELLHKEDGAISPLKTLYIGGGTPALMSASELSGMMTELASHGVRPAHDCEWTIEMNPFAISKERGKIQSFMNLGVNRFSMGVQSLNEVYLQKLGRVHGVSEVHQTLESLAQQNANFSVDLLIGVPHFEKRDIIDELEKLIIYNPSHLSLYILTPKGNYPFLSSMPADELVEKEFLLVSDFLKGHGFHHYEVSNFAKSGFESRHNFKYWRGESVLALGPSAVGLLSNGVEGQRIKWVGFPERPRYELEELNADQLLLESFYLKLRTSDGIWIKDYSQWGDALLANLFSSWAERGLALFDGRHIVLNPAGYLIMDSLMDELFRLME